MLPIFRQLCQNFKKDYVLFNMHGNDNHGGTSHLRMITINILGKRCRQQENATQKKIIDDVISNRKNDAIIIILISRQPKKWKVFIASLFLDMDKLKFGVRGNYGLLFSNLNSKTQYKGLFT